MLADLVHAKSRLIVDSFESTIQPLAENAVEMKVLIAFLTESGLGWLPEELNTAHSFIVGIDLQITTPEALKSLIHRGADVRVFDDPGRMFHPKAVYVRTDDGEYLIVGSHNLTGSGLARNYEMGLMLTRDESTDSVFSDFQAHFAFLQAHEHCFTPDAEFFETYQSSNFFQNLPSRSMAYRRRSVASATTTTAPVPDDDDTGFRGFLLRLAHEFPHVPRRRGAPIKDHPLKQDHDREFVPVFNDLVQSASQGRLTAYSRLNIHGNWYQIPHLMAESIAHEPYELTKSNGQMIVQVHFSPDYKTMSFSVVLHYYSVRPGEPGQMPDRVRDRYRRLLESVERFSERALLDRPAFFHFDYKGNQLWAKPLIGFEYDIADLPGEPALLADFSLICIAMNGLIVVR